MGLAMLAPLDGPWLGRRHLGDPQLVQHLQSSLVVWLVGWGRRLATCCGAPAELVLSCPGDPVVLRCY